MHSDNQTETGCSVGISICLADPVSQSANLGKLGKNGIIVNLTIRPLSSFHTENLKSH